MERGFYFLDQYKKIKIGKDLFNILGFAEFKQGEDFWKKFRIMGEDGDTYWLHVYEAPEKDICKMYYELLPLPGEPLKTIYEAKNYRDIDEGTATVIKLRGISGLSVLDEVFYRDYENIKNTGELLSYERWNDNLNFEYGKGVYVYKEDISFIKGRSIKRQFVELTSSVDLFFEISLGKTILVENEEYTVHGITCFTSKNRNWNEYILRNSFKTSWLYLEKDENKYLAIFGKETEFPLKELGKDETIFKCKVYELMETTTGIIKKTSGDSLNQAGDFIFYTYQTFTSDKTTMIKQWNKGRKTHMGEFIPVTNIIITEKREKTIRPKIPKRLAILLAILFFLSFYFVISTYVNRNSVIKEMKNNSNFFVDKEKINKDTDDKLFYTFYSIDETMAIITRMSNRDFIDSTIIREPNNKYAYFIETRTEIVIIYQTSDNLTYIFALPTEKFSKYNYTLLKSTDPTILTRVKEIISNKHNTLKINNDMSIVKLQQHSSFIEIHIPIIKK